jgi:hypothetical protein
MPKFSILALVSLFIMTSFTACFNDTEELQKVVEKPVEYDQFGNEAVYTADGEREVIDEDCD